MFCGWLRWTQLMDPVSRTSAPFLPLFILQMKTDLMDDIIRDAAELFLHICWQKWISIVAENYY